MIFDYDLVIIGGTYEGYWAALRAVKEGVRVAFVTQDLSPRSDFLYSRSLAYCGGVERQGKQNFWLGRGEIKGLTLREVVRATDEAIASFINEVSPARLRSLGVDLIEGKGEFIRLPHWAFLVGARKLRSRSYLLTTGYLPQNFSLRDFSQISLLTTGWLWQFPEQVPSRLILVGDSPLALELAQGLQRSGKQVTLVNTGQFLPQEDPEGVHLIQAQLESEGIKIITRSPITQIRQLEGQKWLQVGDLALEAEEIIAVTGYLPNLEGLNLEGFKPAPSGGTFLVNEKLAKHPQIYTGHGSLERGCEEYFWPERINLALKNALTGANLRFKDDEIPWCLFTEPNLARVGLTESQARAKYGGKVLVFRGNFKELLYPLMVGADVGFLKIITRPNGKILGASMVGALAGELIGMITMAMTHDLTLHDLANTPLISPTFSEIIAVVARSGVKDLKSQNPWCRFLRLFLKN